MVSTPELKQTAHGTPSAETAAGMQAMTVLGAADLPALRAMDKAEKLTDIGRCHGLRPLGVRSTARS